MFYVLYLFRHYSGEGDDNWVTEATYTQELDLEKQLQWGSRYLDIRVGYCKCPRILILESFKCICVFL